VSAARSRQPERPDFGDDVEPLCSVCDEPLVIDLDEETGTTTYRCPRGHEDRVGEQGTRSQVRESIGELGEDA
jgi:hypothetical protein